MKADEVRELSNEELAKNLRELRESMLNMRMRKEVGQLEKTHEMKLLRRDIARCETIISEKKRLAEQHK
ncbi:MAG: 50S ribosomal protein L29 [Opitutales bacterium]